jgi:hypothetical protein
MSLAGAASTSAALRAHGCARHSSTRTEGRNSRIYSFLPAKKLHIDLRRSRLINLAD